MLKKCTILQFLLMGLIGLIVMTQPVKADTTGLADWCVNLNGDTTSVCNGGTGTSSSTENTSGWNTTLEPGTNGLGKIVVSIGTGAQYASVYMDYDLDFDPYGSFTDFGSVNGTLSGTQSYEMGDPNVPGFPVFSDFASNALADTNNVGTPSGPPAVCCDVSWALAESLTVNPALYSGGTVTFLVSTTAPKSGFYLQQTNAIVGDSIYLSDTVSLTPLSGPPPPVPEPASVLLFATAAAGALILKKRSSAKKA